MSRGLTYSCGDRAVPLEVASVDEDYGTHCLSIVVGLARASRREKGGVGILILALNPRNRFTDVRRNALSKDRDPLAADVVVTIARELQPPEGGVDAHQLYDRLLHALRNVSQRRWMRLIVSLSSVKS